MPTPDYTPPTPDTPAPPDVAALSAKQDDLERRIEFIELRLNILRPDTAGEQSVDQP